MSHNQPRSVVASAARTATGSSSAVGNTSPDEVLNVLANVTAVSGTSPSLTLSVEWSMDGTTFAQGDPADALTAITAAGVKAKQFPRKAPFYRVVWTISGTTPSFTFDVTEW